MTLWLDPVPDNLRQDASAAFLAGNVTGLIGPAYLPLAIRYRRASGSRFTVAWPVEVERDVSGVTPGLAHRNGRNGSLIALADGGSMIPPSIP